MNEATLLPDTAAINAVLAREVDSLPSISVVVVRLLQLTRDNTASIDDLVKLVETDPALGTAVLRRVNSAAYGLRHKIATLKQAVVILGFASIRAIALEVLLYEQVVRRIDTDFDYLSYWRHSLAVAFLSRTMARQLGYPDADIAYSAGLLHDIGKIILEVYGRISYSSIIPQLQESACSAYEAELRLLGVGHDRLGAYFCKRWEFPRPITLAVCLHHQRFAALDLDVHERLLVAIVALANFMAWTQGLGSFRAPQPPVLQPEVYDAIDLGALDLNEMLHAMDMELQDTAVFYRFRFPPMPVVRENLLRTNLDLGRLNSDYFYLEQQKQSRVASIARIKDSLVLPHQSLVPEEIVENTFRAIRQDFAYDRLYLLESEPQTRRLKLVHLQRAERAAALPANLVWEIKPFFENILESLRRRVPVVIAGSTLQEAELLRELGVKELGLVPVTRNGQSAGLIGVDNCCSGQRLQLADLSVVSIIASEMALALEHARLFETYRKRALLDPLTQIYNRGALEDTLNPLFEQAACGGRSLAVCLVDIDFFKKFNDTFGHLVGDDILKVVAGLMQKTSRPTDHVGRFGGEEFIFILPDTSFEPALHFAERFRQRVEQLGQLLEKRFSGHPLSVSVGIAAHEADCRDGKMLIARADQALYAAKKSGRNRVCGYRSGQIVPLDLRA
ncbi:MAG TPA: HDOD domain-containing protein [Methylococcaceae bacterium]|nr:HDOD domain-containing protein [Methylococcaceae bacterium]